MTVGALLRTALQLLENNGSAHAEDGHLAQASDAAISGKSRCRLPPGRSGSTAQQENRCIQVKDNAMAPILADGARVAYSKDEEDPSQLDGKLVVVWLENEPTIRWFQDCGRYAMLRAENPETHPQEQLVDMDAKAAKPRLHRVLWIDTPH